MSVALIVVNMLNHTPQRVRAMRNEKALEIVNNNIPSGSFCSLCRRPFLIDVNDTGGKDHGRVFLSCDCVAWKFMEQELELAMLEPKHG